MQTVTLQPHSRQNTILHPGPARVYIDGRRRRDLRVTTWEVCNAPAFGEVCLEAASGYIQQLFRLPRVGARVLVKSPVGFGLGEFHGVVVQHEVEVGDDGERLVAMVEHRLTTGLNRALLGRWHDSDGSPVLLGNMPLEFNTSPDTLAGGSSHSLPSGRSVVFAACGDTRRWTVADGLAYLLAAHLPAGIKSPGLSELRYLCGDVDLGRYNATGRTLGEALIDIAHRGGLEIRSTRTGLGVVVYNPGRQGRRSRVRLQKAGETLDLSKTNLAGGCILLGTRPSRRPIRVLGAPRQYEATFSLQPGWDSSEETGRWRDFLHDDSDDWNAHRDVFRKWVLNENDRYDGQEYDFSALSDEDFIARRARRFLPCVSTNSESRSRGIVVEFRLSDSDSWQRWAGSVWVSDEECSIRLGGGALPGEFFAAAVSGGVEVRITASVESDRRIEARLGGDVSLPTSLHDLSAQAGWWAIHSSSIFAGGSGGVSVVRDDSARLRIHARRNAEFYARATDATLRLGWIDTSFHAGDIVSRVDGRWLELFSNPQSRPYVHSVRHDFGPARQTQLILKG
ncbi:MAG: hypothetical protein K8S55_03175 [Phycisphaerae bacterium]|nr:hypothetical protein [Phycisphaerae bacterium]